MIIPLSPDRARALQTEFVAGTVQKEYVARCKGRFPEWVKSDSLRRAHIFINPLHHYQ